MTGVACPVPILQFFSNSGAPNVGGSILTTVGGVNTATYQDVGLATPLPNPIPLNSRGEISNASGLSCQLFLTPNVVYVFTMFDSAGNQMNQASYVDGVTLTGEQIGALLVTVTDEAVLAPFVRTAKEIAVGVTPLNYAYAPGDIRRYGGLPDATTSLGTSGTDNSAAVARALSIGIPIYVPAGNWGFKNIILPGGCTFTGDGVEKTNFIALAGATGTPITDNGSSAKTIFKGMSFFCNGPSGGNNTNYTAGLVLGKSIAYGTEGYIDQIEVRDLPSSNAAGFPGIDITGNVGEIGAIYALNTGGVQILGASNMVQYLESTSSQGWLLPGSGQVACVNLQDGTVQGVHVEAPGSYITGGSTFAGGTNTPNFSGSTTVPLVLGGGSGSPGGNVSILNCSLSLAGNAGAITYTFDHLVELCAGASTWSITNLKLYYGGAPGSNAAISAGLIKDSGGNYVGGSSPTTTGSHAPENNYASGLYNVGNTFAVKRQQLQSFKVRIGSTGTAGAIQHRMGTCGDSTVATNFAGQVNNSTNAAQNTPTGADASTPMLAGGKIGSASPSVFWLDTNVIVPADSLFLCTIVSNTTGTAYGIVPFISSININGVTQNRLALQIVNPTSGAGVAWSTVLATPSWVIDIGFLGFLR